MDFLYPRLYPRQSPGYPLSPAYFGSWSGAGLAGITAPRARAGLVAFGMAGGASIPSGKGGTVWGYVPAQCRELATGGYVPFTFHFAAL